MYFKYDESRGIQVDKPFRRMMMPYMMPDTASCPINFPSTSPSGSPAPRWMSTPIRRHGGHVLHLRPRRGSVGMRPMSSAKTA